MVMARHGMGTLDIDDVDDNPEDKDYQPHDDISHLLP